MTAVIIIFLILPFISAFFAIYLWPWIKDDKPIASKKSNPLSSGMHKSTELAVPDPEPVKYEMYGHPAPPIALLGASLPQAPLGYGWEITTVINDDGNPALRLALLDLKTITEVDAIEQDLVVVRKWKYANDDTYAAFYRRAIEIEDRECEKIYKAKYEHWREMSRYDHYGYAKCPEKPRPDGKLAGKVMMANLITPMVDWAALLTLRYFVNNPDETKCNYMLIEAK